MKNLILTATIILAAWQIAPAQYGILDPTFGSGGTALFADRNAGFFEMAIAFQADGKVLATTGYDSSTLVRLNPNGSIDPTFGTGGWVSLGYMAVGDIQLQSDGKILVATQPVNISYGDLYVWRLNANGSIDSTFGNNGRAADTSLGTGIEHVAIQPGGKITFSGALGMKRLNTDGSTDTTFGTGGFVHYTQLPIYIWALAVDSTGAVLLGGPTRVAAHLAVARLTIDGQPDHTFGSGGVDSLSIIIGNLLVYTANVKVISSGQIIFAGDYDAGSGTDRIFCARFTANGIPDSTFGTNGMVYPSWAVSHGYFNFGGIAVQPDDKIFVVCTLEDSSNLANGYDIGIVRLMADGSTDATFGTPRLDINHGAQFAGAVGVGPDGKLYINGRSDSSLLVARYTTGLPGGIHDESIASSSIAVYPNPLQNTATMAFTAGDQNEISADIYSSDGRLIKHIYNNTILPAGAYQKIISLSDVAPGIYQLIYSNNGVMQHVSIVKM
jgi:uncharacterized delta-60 repeat protein